MSIARMRGFARPLARRVACALLAVLVTGLAGSASADSLQRGDLPVIEGITLIGVENGQLKYRVAAGDRSAPLSEINAVVIESVPQFAVGQRAFKENQLRNAQRAFESVWADSRVDWIRDYAGYYLTQVYNQRNEPVEAGRVYARLASNKADLFFLSKPPVASLAGADADQKNRIRDEVMAVIQQTEGAYRDRLQAYLRAVVGEGGAMPDLTPDRDDRDQQQRADSAVILPERVWKLLDRPNDQDKWAAVRLLSEGKYQEALDAIKPWLSNPGDLPDKLYIYGRAQLGLADQGKDKDLYEDAGLTFMRIVVHFAGSQSQPHPMVAPAQLEVAYIHKQIGREDIYERMLFGGGDAGGLNLVIDDPEAYPQYRLRYYQIIGETPPEEEPPADDASQ